MTPPARGQPGYVLRPQLAATEAERRALLDRLGAAWALKPGEPLARLLAWAQQDTGTNPAATGDDALIAAVERRAGMPRG